MIGMVKNRTFVLLIKRHRPKKKSVLAQKYFQSTCLLAIYLLFCHPGQSLHLMILFINYIPVKILETGSVPDPAHYNQFLDAASEPITQAKLINHVWIKNVGDQDFYTLLGLLNSHVPTNILSVIVSTAGLPVKKYLRT